MADTWSEGEIDVIVNDYLVMLKLEQTGKAFIKTDHWRVLMEVTGRTRGAIEYKHSNISAAMEALGLPRINGYRPRGKNLKTLIEAVEAQLNERPELYNLFVGEAETLQNRIRGSISGESLVFDKMPPQRETSEQAIREDNEPIGRRFENPAERDARNRSLGKAGELFVYEYERHRLQTIGREDLSDRVRWVARDDGDGYGYDILSFVGKGDEADQERWLEIKTTTALARPLSTLPTTSYVCRRKCLIYFGSSGYIISESRCVGTALYRLWSNTSGCARLFIEPLSMC